MIIVFDGGDNTGKTTIAKALSEKLGIPYYSHERPVLNRYTDPLLSEMHIAMLRYGYGLLHAAQADLIIDRAHPSEFVYGTMLRKAPKRFIQGVDALLAEYGGKLIICRKGKIVTKADETLKVKQLGRAHMLFQEFVKNTKCDVLYLNTTDEDLRSQLTKITNFIYDYPKEQASMEQFI